MPQLNPEFFISQLFWLVITFSFLIVFLWKISLPRINTVLERRENKINDTSIVYTSGSAGLFKPGIPIGKINNQELEILINGKISNEKKVDFFSDFSQLDFVEVASFQKVDSK